MNNRSIRIIPLLLAVLAAAQGASAKTLQPIFHYLACANGYANAYNVLIVDMDTGCVQAAWGVDCSGKEYTIEYSIRPLSGDPNRPYTVMETLIGSNGATFHVKAQFNAAGEVEEIWGMDASGRYYRVVQGD